MACEIERGKNDLDKRIEALLEKAVNQVKHGVVTPDDCMQMIAEIVGFMVAWREEYRLRPL